MTNIFSISCPDQLRREAQKHGINISRVCREAIADEINAIEQQEKVRRWKVTGDASAKTAPAVNPIRRLTQ